MKYKAGDKVLYRGNTYVVDRNGVGKNCSLKGPSIYFEDDPDEYRLVSDQTQEEVESIMDNLEKSLNQEKVKHPDHYNKSSIECIDAIKASLGPDGFIHYCKGNCMKYLWRYEYKNGLEDLEKAEVYLKWMIETMREGDS